MKTRDRIDELEADLKVCAAQLEENTAVMNAAAARIEALEAALRSCRDAMRHSRDHRANTDWSRMIAAIEVALAPECK